MDTNDHTSHVTVRRANMHNKDNINGALLANALGDHIHVLGTETESAPLSVGVRITTLTLAQLEQKDANVMRRNYINYTPIRGLQTDSS